MINNELTLDQLESVSGGIDRQPHPNMPKTNWMKRSKNMSSKKAFLPWHRSIPSIKHGIHGLPEGDF